MINEDCPDAFVPHRTFGTDRFVRSPLLRSGRDELIEELGPAAIDAQARMLIQLIKSDRNIPKTIGDSPANIHGPLGTGGPIIAGYLADEYYETRDIPGEEDHPHVSALVEQTQTEYEKDDDRPGQHLGVESSQPDLVLEHLSKPACGWIEELGSPHCKERR